MLPLAPTRYEGQGLSEVYDIVVIGGGVNGCGIARDAAGRGLKVLLCERGDLAGATSSASTKLIHGGLRYLEHYAFHLVSHALAERETLWKIAPHIIWPMRFVLPYRKGLRPAWMLRLGLFLYDHIGGRKLLPATRTLRLNRDPVGAPLRDVSGIGFEYSDGWVQDARLVVLNARDAEARGAKILTRTNFLSAREQDALWVVDLADVETGARQSVTARAIVNAAGPWVAEALGHVAGAHSGAGVRLVQGSHVVIKKLYEHDRCYFFQNPDGRIFFVIPYEEEFTLIGTTDQDYQGDPAKAHATEAEIDYLCAAASSYFKHAVGRDDVVWTYSGVRPLYDDGASAAKDATRDYVLTFQGGPGQAALLNVFGGKITTYRRLAEDALAKLAVALPQAAQNIGWTAKAALPGGDFFSLGAQGLATELRNAFPFLDARRARRLVRHYGTEARRWLKADCGRDFGGDLTEAEVEFLMDFEYARTAEDIVWRRTKSALRMSPAEIADLDVWMKARRPRPAMSPEFMASH
jgi:glycerol-3-phosphate dehydrogenase